MSTTLPSRESEWLETDGLGGFASGTVSGVRTRRYHGLLVPATMPPAGRTVLVNGFEAWVELSGATFAISSQRYNPDVFYPNGVDRLSSCRLEPWPIWTFDLSAGFVSNRNFLRYTEAKPWRCLGDWPAILRCRLSCVFGLFYQGGTFIQRIMRIVLFSLRQSRNRNGSFGTRTRTFRALRHEATAPIICMRLDLTTSQR
jgi:hypothetical protein